MDFLNELDRGWQKVVNFKVGDVVDFSVPYFEGKFHYKGRVLELKGSYAKLEYYEPLNDLTLITHINLIDEDGYRRITKSNGD